MTHLNIELGITASAVVILGGIWGLFRWLHHMIVKSVKEQIEPIDNAVNHRSSDQPRLIEVIDMIWDETQRQGKEIDELGRRFERHLGWHDHANDSTS